MFADEVKPFSEQEMEKISRILSSLARSRSLPPSEARAKAMERQRAMGNDGKTFGERYDD